MSTHEPRPGWRPDLIVEAVEHVLARLREGAPLSDADRDLACALLEAYLALLSGTDARAGRPEAHATREQARLVNALIDRHGARQNEAICAVLPGASASDADRIAHACRALRADPQAPSETERPLFELLLAEAAARL